MNAEATMIAPELDLVDLAEQRQRSDEFLARALRDRAQRSERLQVARDRAAQPIVYDI